MNGGWNTWNNEELKEKAAEVREHRAYSDGGE